MFFRRLGMVPRLGSLGGRRPPMDGGWMVASASRKMELLAV
jgi:hypothetical protein